MVMAAKKKKPGEKPKRNPWGAQLQELRDAVGLTQAAAAELLGVSLRTYQGWEIGKSAPPAWTRHLVEAAIRARM